MHKWTNPHLQHLLDMEPDRVELDADEAVREAGAALKRERTRQRMTQKQLSAVTGVPQAQISRIENGRESAPLETYARLAGGLHRRLRLKLVREDEEDE